MKYNNLYNNWSYSGLRRAAYGVWRIFVWGTNMDCIQPIAYLYNIFEDDNHDFKDFFHIMAGVYNLLLIGQNQLPEKEAS